MIGSDDERVGCYSYGHDIEVLALYKQCAEIIGKKMDQKNTGYAVKLTNAAMSGIDKDGGLWYEYEQKSKHLGKESIGWPGGKQWSVSIIPTRLPMTNLIYCRHQ